MTGATQEDYAEMMLAGGRSVEGNRSRSGRDAPAKPAARKAARKAAAKTGAKSSGAKSSPGSAAKRTKKAGSKRG
jgi:hypothetical protein